MVTREESLEDFATLCRARLQYVVPVREPLVLISQIQRSGGTLLSQLFDGHRQVHAHPQELKIGYPKKQTWPALDLEAEADTWFEILREPTAERAFRRGYQKPSKALLKELAPGEAESFPFLFLPSLQRQIFEHALEAKGAERERDILDAYMTSYFNAWLDNHNLYTGPKKIVTGFTPRLARRPENLVKFFAAYPDGRLLTLVRNPHSWFVSARKHAPTIYGDIDKALKLWLSSTRASVDAKERYGDRVFLLSYEDLVQDLRGVMERLAGHLGIDFEPILLEPTFNTFPIRANSAFRVSGPGIITDPLARQQALSTDEYATVERHTRDLYDHTLARRS